MTHRSKGLPSLQLAAPTHTDRTTFLILPSARTLTQITSRNPRVLIETDLVASHLTSSDLKQELKWFTEWSLLLILIETN